MMNIPRQHPSARRLFIFACFATAAIIYVFFLVTGGNKQLAWLTYMFKSLPPCSVRHIWNSTDKFAYINESIPTFTDLKARFGRTLHNGGIFKPHTCTATSRVAILVPFRDRETHLPPFLNHMHSFLQKQNIMYGIYVVEIDQSSKFNRAALMNIGFVEALKEHNYTCIVIHDVDLLPEDHRIMYTCPQKPVHLAVLSGRYGYRLIYPDYFGGVSIIPTHIYKLINGMSNLFFGWGGEDDELLLRLKLHNIDISRPPGTIPRYKALVHKNDTDINLKKYCLLETTKERSKVDGLNSLQYTLLDKIHTTLYTWIYVRVNVTQIIEKHPYVYKYYKKCYRNEEDR